MHSVPATISLTARLRIKDEIPDFPELKDAHVKRETDAAFPGTQGEIRFALTKFSLAQIGEILQRQRLTIGFGYLNDYYHDRFWDEIPDECAGGFLSVDGYVSFPPGIDSYHIVPMGEPLYTNSRPDGDADHSRHQPQVLSGGGGIPILSNRLISALKQLGVEGEIAILVYRGFNKKAYDTRQPGFKRYLPQARFEMIDEIGMDFFAGRDAGRFSSLCRAETPQHAVARPDRTVVRDRRATGEVSRTARNDPRPTVSPHFPPRRLAAPNATRIRSDGDGRECDRWQPMKRLS